MSTKKRRIVIERIKLRKIGLFSFIRRYKFVMCISDKSNSFSISLSVKDENSYFKGCMEYLCVDSLFSYLEFKDEYKLENTVDNELKNIVHKELKKELKNEFNNKVDNKYENDFDNELKDKLKDEYENKGDNEYENKIDNEIKFVEEIKYYENNFCAFKVYDGRIYYLDYSDLRISWNKIENRFKNELPCRWEKKENKDGNVFYINHNNCTTTWKHPIPSYRMVRIVQKIKKYIFYSKLRDFLYPFNSQIISLSVKRNFYVQSTALKLIESTQADPLKNIFIEFIDEIGEDHGALLREYFYKTSLEIAQDYRIQDVGGFYDVKPMTEQYFKDVEYLITENLKKYIKIKNKPKNKFFLKSEINEYKGENKAEDLKNKIGNNYLENSDKYSCEDKDEIKYLENNFQSQKYHSSNEIYEKVKNNSEDEFFKNQKK
ncbi:hypothetical protein CWI36_1506p0030 [Hamiltosporidium magnivora]|uniref:WW domain-containing protein n=1 Tax=Hamiltosporidium magnivora TaxID=148818 RepID=A0A4Q9L0M1_9MICR|nr:hypothetical protein CWI36_1506p0030 [Hamiltosporidium magnivora]